MHGSVFKLQSFCCDAVGAQLAHYTDRFVFTMTAFKIISTFDVSFMSIFK